ncbi:MAG: hypothetical protein RR264_12920 [Pseudomonas sp.]
MSNNTFHLGVETTLNDLDWCKTYIQSFDETGEWTHETFMFLLMNRYDGDMSDVMLMAYFDHGASLPKGLSFNHNPTCIEY